MRRQYRKWRQTRFSPSQAIWVPIEGFHCHTIIKTIQQIKSRIKEVKEDEHSNSLAKIQVCAIFRAGDIRRNVLLKFIRLCMDTPEANKNRCHRVCYQKPIVVFWGLINFYMSTYSHTGTVQIATFQQISHFFNLRYGILGRPFNIVSRKSLEIQSCFTTRRKTLSNWEFVKRYVFSCSNN